MLAERKHPGRPMSVRALAAAIALGLGLAGSAVGSAGAADAPGAVKLAIAVPIVVPPSSDEFLDADTLRQYTSDRGILTQQLDAVLDRPVAIGIDPRIIVSIRLLGSSAPASALVWLDRLETATNETFALDYADADISLLTQAGSTAVLQSESFDFAIDPTLFAPVASTGSPAPTATPVDPVLPDLPTDAELTDWPYTLTGIAWPREDTLIASDLPTIAGSGYATTIVASGNISKDAASGPVAKVGDAGVLVSDAAVSLALRTGTTSSSEPERAAARTDLSNALAAGARVQSGTATLFATLGRTMNLDHLSEILDSLVADPAVQLVPLTQVVSADPASAAIIDEPQAADRISRAGQMIQGEVAERAFASVASDPTAITDNRRLEILALFSAEWADNLDGWPEAADAFTTASIALRNAVHLVESNNFLLIADNGQYLPITVTNGLDQPVTVHITVRSQSALLAIDNGFATLDIKPGTQGKVDIPVHSLSNGVVGVDVSITSSTGVPIGAPINAEVNVQAGWETPIVIAFAALVIVVFGVGIVRTVLRRRKGGADD